MMISTETHPSLEVTTDRQRLQLLPTLGASIASWETLVGGVWVPVLRPWNRASVDAFTFACFPLVPWSNRIGKGGFTHDEVYYPIVPNRAGEPYPIHGDGWLQPWQVHDSERHNEATLHIESRHAGGDPYHYRARQHFDLHADGLTITLSVTHLGKKSLPYGLGLHPYFLRDADTLLQMQCDGLWLSDTDPMPVAHSDTLPPTFDYREPALLQGPMIDHCFTGWDGQATITYPSRGMEIEFSMRDCDGYALMYRPPGLDFFCLEPITHPIDAFHMPQRPGLRILEHRQSMKLELTLRVQSI
ncbi:MAG: aldose 1-epimerase [Pseudomonadota bacterium]